MNNIKLSNKIKFNINDRLEPGVFLNNLLGYKNVEPIEFYETFRNRMSSFFNNKKNNNQWKELIKTNKSCNRNLYWQVIYVPPYHFMHIHAHVTVEYDYVAEGEIYQIRCKNEYNSNYYLKNLKGPDISKLSKNDFFLDKTTKNNAIINDIGSIHISFTKSKPCKIFSLFSGDFASIQHIPYFLNNFNPKQNIFGIYRKSHKKNTRKKTIKKNKTHKNTRMS